MSVNSIIISHCLFILSCLCSFYASAQFDGKAGSPGSEAIFADSSIIKNWANGCKIIRGRKNISQPEMGFSESGNGLSATGKAGENGVVSLGDSGVAILTFPKPVVNGPGADFAVFENAFLDNFLELAFVEVSSDGNRFFRFPSISNTATLPQIGPFDTLSDPSLIRNLAGKYRAFFGTPFDLEELKDSNGLDISAITHVRIVDAVGSIDPQWGSTDSRGRMVNDPFPTPFESGGFDLDAVGVIHERVENDSPLYFFPNPTDSRIQLKENAFGISEFYLADWSGKKVNSSAGLTMDLSSLPDGIYFAISETTNTKKLVQKIWKKK